MNFKRISLLMAILVASAFLFSSTAYASVKIVGCGDQEYKTIQAAVDACITGDSIHVTDCLSPYSENVTIAGKDIVIGTDGKDVVTLQAPVSGVGRGFFISGVAYCHIHGFTIDDFYDGVYGQNSSGIWLDHNDYFNCARAGVVFNNTDNSTIDGQEAAFCGTGILLANDSDGNKISDLFVHNNVANGIEIINGSDGNNVDPGEITGNGGDGVFLDNSDGNTIQDQEIHHNGGNGFRLINASDGNFFNANTIYKNGLYGGWIAGGCLNNQIFSNCFFNNHETDGQWGIASQGFDASGSRHWDDYGTPKVGNYWNDAVGAPYLIDGGPLQDRGPKAATVAVIPASQTIACDGQTSVNVDLDMTGTTCAPNQSVFGFEVFMSFNAAKLSLDGVTWGDLRGSSTCGETFRHWELIGTNVIKVTEMCLGETCHVALDVFKLFDLEFTGLGGLDWAYIKIDSIEILDHPQKHPIYAVGVDGWIKLADFYAPVLSDPMPYDFGEINSAPVCTSGLVANEDAICPEGLDGFYGELSPGFTWIAGGGALMTKTFYSNANTWLAGQFGALAEGPHKAYFKVKDLALNESNVCSLIFEKDTQAPGFAGIAVEDGGLATEPAEPGWTNELTVSVTITADLDAIEMYVREWDIGAAGWVDAGTGWISFSSPYMFSLNAGLGDGMREVRVKVRDLAGNASGWKAAQIELDTNPPALTTFVLDGGAAYNNTGTASGDPGGYAGPIGGLRNFWKYELTENQTSHTGWYAAADPINNITLTAGDGGKEVCCQIRDMAGNVSATVCDSIILDTSLPTGGLVAKDRAPNSHLAAPGYTNELLVDLIATYDPTATQVCIQNSWLGSNLGTQYIALNPPASPHTVADWNITSGIGGHGQGVYHVRYSFRDAAGNWTPWDTASIIYDSKAPPCPDGFVAAHGPDGVKLTWTHPTSSDYYGTLVKDEPWNGYPEYPLPEPLYPSNPDDAFVTCDEERPEDQFYLVKPKDILYFSCWAYDSAGNYSSSGYLTARSTSYILGDFDCNGHVDWDDALIFSMAYNTNTGPPPFNPACDIGPTAWNWNAAHPSNVGHDPDSIPVPDGHINFNPDLMIFANNYCKVVDPKLFPAEQVPFVVLTTSAERSGDVVVAKLSIDNANGLKGMHIAFDYNTDQFELVSVDRGELLSKSDIFFWKAKDRVEFDAAALGRGTAIGGSGEIVTMRFKVIGASDFSLSEKEIDLRDADNREIPFSFNKVIAVMPASFALSQNYPNPFNPNTHISFALPEASNVTLKIYNIAGQLVKTLVNDELAAGHHTVMWNGTNSSGSEVGSGIYLYRLETEKFTSVKKMILMK